MMSLYAANNIAAAIRGFGKRGYAKLRGLILNAKNIENEESIVREALKEIGTGLVQYIPRSQDIQTAEAGGGTVFQVLDASPMCGVYNRVGRQASDRQRSGRAECRLLNAVSDAAARAA